VDLDTDVDNLTINDADTMAVTIDEVYSINSSTSTA